MKKNQTIQITNRESKYYGKMGKILIVGKEFLHVELKKGHDPVLIKKSGENKRWKRIKKKIG